MPLSRFTNSQGLPLSHLPRQLHLWRVVRDAPPEGVRLRDLARRFGVAKNTVQRDLNELSRAGLPIVEIQRSQTIWFSALKTSADGFGIPVAPPADPTRLAAAMAALAPFGPGLGAHLNAPLAVGEPPFFEPEPLRSARAAPPEVIETLAQGILEHHRCRITYLRRDSEAARHYLVEPWMFTLHQGLLYLRAAVPPHSTPATFAAHLVERATLTTETFTPGRFSRTGFGIIESTPRRVRVRFSAEIATFIRERRWHPTQTLKERRDGSLVLEAKLSGMHEFVGWVMSWGDGAELLAPADWRAELLRRARGVVAAHGRKRPPRQP